MSLLLFAKHANNHTVLLSNSANSQHHRGAPALAQQGEDFACQVLQSQGHHVLARNWRYSRFAEIDIITQHPQTGVYHFIEVKTRQLQTSTAMAGYTESKRQHLLLAVQSYCQSQGLSLEAIPLQVDWIAVTLPPAGCGTTPSFVLYPNILQVDAPAD